MKRWWGGGGPPLRGGVKQQADNGKIHCIIYQLLLVTNAYIILHVDMSTISEKLGANVRRIRLEKGFTQKDFCKKVGLDAAYLSNIENGNMNPTVTTVEKIAKALGVSNEDLIK